MPIIFSHLLYTHHTNTHTQHFHLPRNNGISLCFRFVFFSPESITTRFHFNMFLLADFLLVYFILSPVCLTRVEHSIRVGVCVESVCVCVSFFHINANADALARWICIFSGTLHCFPFRSNWYGLFFSLSLSLALCVVVVAVIVELQQTLYYFTAINIKILQIR